MLLMPYQTLAEVLKVNLKHKSQQAQKAMPNASIHALKFLE